jgi:hypothetical protein
MTGPNVPATDTGAEGLAGVAVARRERRYRVSVAGYLVDTYCLGLKDALGPQSMSDSDLPAFLRRFYAAFGDDTGPLAVPLGLARHLVWGAVEHAKRLGFQRHPDFAAVSGHLGTWDETSAITFGRDASPSTSPDRTTTPARSSAPSPAPSAKATSTTSPPSAEPPPTSTGVSSQPPARRHGIDHWNRAGS